MPKQTALLLRDNQTALETRDAVPRPSTFDPQALTVEAIIASSAPVRRQDVRGGYNEVLDPTGLDLSASAGVSVLDSHRQGGVAAVLGTLDSVRVEGDQVVGLIRFSSRPEIAAIVEDVRAGIVSHLSVGYEVSQWRERDAEPGAPRTRTASRWVIREVSFVPVPADRTARTRNLPTGSGRASVNRSIRELCQRAGVDQTLTDDLIDREASIEDCRALVLDALVTRGRTPIMTAHNVTTLDNPAAFVRAAGEALHHRVAPTSQPSGQARQYIGMTIPELARETLRRSGENVTGLSAPELVTRALHTTSDFSLILADTVGRTLRESYTAAPSGVRSLARQTTAADFRTKHRLMLDSTGVTLEKVNEHGEFRSGTMAEGEETYKVDTFGRIFGITRQALVNDDVGAFTDLSRRLGQAAAAFEAQFLVDLLVSNAGLGPLMRDGQELFDATHGNINTAAGAAPSETTLSEARLAMRKQTGLGGGLIDVSPFALLIPSDIETATEKVLTTIRPMTVDDANPFSTLRLIVEPRLTAAAPWYVVANPATVDGLEMCYLAGAPGPQVESQAGFKVDGVEIRVRLDYGAGFVDHRGWYRNAGTAG